jgi:hypothetical protein
MAKFTLLFTLALLIAACSKPAAPPKPVPPTPAPQTRAQADTHDHGAESAVPRISIAEAKRHFDARDAVFVDTHSPEQFAVQHIPGAVNIPGNDIGTRADKLPKGKKIIAYCS